MYQTLNLHMLLLSVEPVGNVVGDSSVPDLFSYYSWFIEQHLSFLGAGTRAWKKTKKNRILKENTFAWFLWLGWLSQPDSWCENGNPSPDNQKGAVKVACCLLIQIRWHLICQFSHQLHIWQVVSIATNNIYSVIGLRHSPIKIWCTLGYSFEIFFRNLFAEKEFISQMNYFLCSGLRGRFAERPLENTKERFITISKSFTNI